MNIAILRSAAEAVRKRSGGTCERCHVRTATHLHHLTYERASRELPADLLHLCVFCHAKEHPEKAGQLFRFEMKIRGRSIREMLGLRP